jgi:hypothetical protein
MTLQSLFDEVERLPVAEKWRLVRHLLNDLDAEQEAPPKEDWANFVNRMYGALADDPIERPQQWPLTEREPID